MHPIRPTKNDMHTAIALLEMTKNDYFCSKTFFHIHFQRSYLKFVGYNSTVTSFMRYDPVPVTKIIVNRVICTSGISIHMHKNAHEPPPIKIKAMRNELISKLVEILEECLLFSRTVCNLPIMENFDILVIRTVIKMKPVKNEKWSRIPFNGMLLSSFVVQTYER